MKKMKNIFFCIVFCISMSIGTIASAGSREGLVALELKNTCSGKVTLLSSQGDNIRVKASSNLKVQLHAAVKSVTFTAIVGPIGQAVKLNGLPSLLIRSAPYGQSQPVDVKLTC